ncbi:pseudouridine synthase [Lewinellaceae bacterium SD302]|nr:pseudouridine synthase [Lewinellaceae bacterium SD302]
MRNSLFILLTLMTFGLYAQDEVKMTKLTSVEGITEYEIENNGLRVLLFPDKSKETATVNITYKVGSRHEAYGETGMAHLLEHLVFKGTPDHPDIPAELTEHGARPNGTTWYDRTNYFETFASTEENIEWALDLEADRMVNSFIAKKDLDSEMTVVRNEFESGENSPVGVLMQRTMNAAYLWHNYGKTTIGSKADLENVPIGRLQDFYRKYYQPDNAVLMVSGKFDEEKTIELIKEKFGNIPAPNREDVPLYPTYTREPVQDGERFVELKRVGDVQVVQALYHIPAGAHPDYPVVDIITEALTSEPNGRLYKALVEEGLATSVWGFAPALAEPGFALFNMEILKDDDMMAAEKAMKKVFDELAENPLSDEEIKRAKDRMLKNFELVFRNTERVGTGVSEYIAQGDWRLAFIYRDRLEQVTPEMVSAVAERYFLPSNRTTGRFIPTDEPLRAEIPEVNSIEAIVDGYEGREAIAEGEEFEPSPDNIDGRTITGTLPGTNFKYKLLPKETRGNSVVATMTLRFGNLDKLKGRATEGEFVGSMLMMGSKNYDRQAIQDKLDAMKAQVSISGSAENATVRIETENERLVEVLEFVGEILTTPTFPEEELAIMKKERLAGVESSRSEPQAIAAQELFRRLRPYPKDHPDYRPTFDEEVARINDIDQDDLEDFYEDFYGASDATFGASGDMDADAVVMTLKEQFGKWKSPAKYKRIASKHFDVAGESVKLETPDKANAMFLAAQNLPISQDHPDYAALTLANYMLGGGFLNSRLASRIRAKDGLSYGVGSQMNASAIDETGLFLTYAIYNPSNREALEKAFKEEIDLARAEGFTQEEIDAARGGWVQSRSVRRAQDNSMAGQLNDYAYLGRTMQWDEALEEKVMKLTPADVNAAMTKYIDVDKMISVKAGDFKKTEGVKKP